MKDFNISLFSRNKRLLDKQDYGFYSQALPLAKNIWVSGFLAFSINWLIAEPPRTTKCTKTPLGHTLTNSLKKRWFRVVLLKWYYLTMISFVVLEKHYFWN